MDDPELPTEQVVTPAVQAPMKEDRLAALRGRKVLVKYGGNAMVDEDCKRNVISDICELKRLGIIPVIVHGGGPAIGDLLESVGMKSEFIGGHRKTDKATMGYVEMALRGKVNSDIVKRINRAGYRAVGLSGKDAMMVRAERRIHRYEVNGRNQRTDLGHVGDVTAVDTTLVELLLREGYIPVIAPIGVGEDGEDYNINADMFAGHLAGALGVEHYIVLTDVDGLRVDRDDPTTRIPELDISRARDQAGKIIQGGMIPKVESCIIALEKGAGKCHIIDGTVPRTILNELPAEESTGTRITGKRNDEK